ncbi:MAG: accessory factor UbiK family protein [Rhodospirillaceae bacterium]|nr:accessory factor UbiK family protein [Rhodospirillaceae bacterium]
MQTSNRLLDDLAKVANGAASGIVGLKAEAETMVRQQLQRLLSDANMVSRDEFDAIKAVATKARAEQEKLQARLSELEAHLGLKVTKQGQSAAKASTKKKTKAVE